MAKHLNCNRLLRTTRADIKKDNCEQENIEINENSSKKMRSYGWLLTQWLTVWLTGLELLLTLLIINTRTTTIGYLSVSMYVVAVKLTQKINTIKLKIEKNRVKTKKIYTFTVVKFLYGTYLIATVQNAVTHSENDNWNYFCILLFLFCCFVIQLYGMLMWVNYLCLKSTINK